MDVGFQDMPFLCLEAVAVNTSIASYCAAPWHAGPEPPHAGSSDLCNTRGAVFEIIQAVRH